MVLKKVPNHFNNLVMTKGIIKVCLLLHNIIPSSTENINFIKKTIKKPRNLSTYKILGSNFTSPINNPTIQLINVLKGAQTLPCCYSNMAAPMASVQRNIISQINQIFPWMTYHIYCTYCSGSAQGNWE